MKSVLIGLLGCAAFAASHSAIERMLDPKLTSAQRNEACFELRRVRSEEAIEAMRQMLSNDPLRTCAATNLREAGAIIQLKDALVDESPEVRAIAARELGMLARPELIEALAKAARDPNMLVATNAVYALSQYQDRGVLPYLLELAKGGGAAGAMALNRAAEFRDPRVLALARQLTSNSDVAVRMYAINVIGDLGDASDLPQLRKIAATHERLLPSSRGFGLLPAIDIARAAKTAIARIQERASK